MPSSVLQAGAREVSALVLAVRVGLMVIQSRGKCIPHGRIQNGKTLMDTKRLNADAGNPAGPLGSQV